MADRRKNFCKLFTLLVENYKLVEQVGTCPSEAVNQAAATAVARAVVTILRKVPFLQPGRGVCGLWQVWHLGEAVKMKIPIRLVSFDS